MPVCLYVDAPADLKERLACVEPGTDAKIKAANKAYRDAPQFSGEGEDPALTTLDEILGNVDPQGVYSLTGDHDQGLHRLQTDRDYLRQRNLDPHVDGTNDPALVREILVKQRAYAGASIVIGAQADVDECDRIFLAVINRLIAALDADINFGLYWA